MEKMETKDYTIGGLLEDERETKIFLPHFQRAFIWKPDQQKSLIQSILAGAPIGSFLFIKEAHNAYATRALCEKEVDSDKKKIDPTREYMFLLDGQQRVSAIKSICDDIFYTGDKTNKPDWKLIWKRTYYDLKNRWFLSFAEEDDIFGWKNLNFDAIEFDTLEPDKFSSYIKNEKILSNPNAWYHPTKCDFSNNDEDEKKFIETAVQLRHLPLWLLLSPEERGHPVLSDILRGIANKKGFTARQVDVWVSKVLNFIWKRFAHTLLPSVILPREKTSLAIAIFEQINRGGQRLSNYDLIVARVARKSPKLRLTESIRDFIKSKHGESNPVLDTKGSCKEWAPLAWNRLGIWDARADALSPVFTNAFLDCLAIECHLSNTTAPLTVDTTKKTALLNLSAEAIDNNWQKVISNLLLVVQFLVFRCGLRSLGALQYKLMIWPLYVVFREEDEKKLSRQVIQRCEYWFWTSIFSGWFRDQQNKQAIFDCENLYAWCKRNEGDKITSREDNVLTIKNYADRASLTFDKDGASSTSLKDSFLQFLVSQGLNDWSKENQKIYAWLMAANKMPVDEHHIVPQGESNSDSRDGENPIESPLNITYLLRDTNQKISHVTSRYSHIEKLHDAHLLNKECLQLAQDYQKTPADQIETRNDVLKNFLNRRFDYFDKALRNRLIALKD